MEAGGIGGGEAAGGKPIAVAVHLENVNMVRQPIQQRSGETFRAEHRGPFVKREVGGDERAATLVALAQHLKQQFATNGGERDITQFIDDQQFDLCKVLLELA